MAKSGRLHVAVIGAGNMGKNHVRNYFLLPDAELVGLSDINPLSEGIAREYKTAFYTDYKNMLDEVKPDAVSVVVPTPLHYQVGMDVMSRGIHCLMEKPIASSVAEADKLIAYARKMKVVFTVGHIEHYNPLIRKLKEMVDQNRIGDITSVVCKRVGGFPVAEPKTDVIIDLAVHDIDIINYLLDKKPMRIYSHGSRTHHSKKIDSAEILMDYGRASGFVQANWLTPVKIRTIALTGSNGYLEGNYITQELELYRHNMKKINDGFSNFVIQMGEPEREIQQIDFEEPLALELKTFLAAAADKPIGAVVKPEDARDALGLALEAVESFEK